MHSDAWPPGPADLGSHSHRIASWLGLADNLVLSFACGSSVSHQSCRLSHHLSVISPTFITSPFASSHLHAAPHVSAGVANPVGGDQPCQRPQVDAERLRPAGCWRGVKTAYKSALASRSASHPHWAIHHPPCSVGVDIVKNSFKIK